MDRRIATLLLCLLPGTLLAQGTIRDMPDASSVAATDGFFCDQGVTAVTRECLASQIATYVLTGIDTVSELEALISDLTAFIDAAGGTMTGDLTLDDGTIESPEIILNSDSNPAWNFLNSSGVLQMVVNTGSTEDFTITNTSGGVADLTVDGTITGTTAVAGPNVTSGADPGHTHSAAGSTITVNAADITDLNAGTDITADLEEETHATEHSDGAADEIVATNLASACTDAQVLGGDGAGGVECQTDAGGGGTANILDLADDASNESVDLVEIATTGDTNSVFTEPSADKLLIDLGSNWPTADTADAMDAANLTGTVLLENGGMEADTTTWGEGLFGITGGTTSVDVDTVAELDTALGLTGTPSSSTYFRGDGTWSTPGGSGDITTVGDCTTGDCLDGTAGTTITLGTTDPADAGAIRLENAEVIAWEASPTGTDVTLGVDSSEVIQITGGKLDGGDLVDASVDALQLAGGSVGATEIQDDAVGTAELDDGADTPVARDIVHVDPADTGQMIYYAAPAGGTNGCAGSADKVIFNSTTGTWGCGADAGAGGGMTSFTVQADDTNTMTVTDGETVDIAGGTGLDTVAATGSPEQLTINVNEAGMEGLLDLPDLQGTLTAGQYGAGTIDQADIDDTATIAANPAWGDNSTWFGTTGLIFEGLTSNTFETMLTVVDPTADRTISLPDATGTLITGASVPANETDPTLTDDGAVTVGSGASTMVQTFDVTGTDGTITYDGTDFTFSAPIASGPSATPALDLYDSDGTDADINARLYGNLTDTGSGTEDMDITLAGQRAGTEANHIAIDADAGITLGHAATTALTVTTDSTGDAEVVLPTGSIGSGEVAALDTADVTTGTWADARVAASNVTQHEASLSIAGAQVDSGTVPVARVGAGHIDATTEINGALCGTNEILEDQGAAWACIATPAGGSTAFSGITTGTNSSATMTVGTGASIAISGSGTVAATDLTCTGCVGITDIGTSAVDQDEIAPGGVGNSEIATDVVQLDELDDDANTPLAGNFLIVETGAATVDYLAANAGTDITADLEEETHASEHSENAADEIFAEGVGTACTINQILKSDGAGGLDCAADATGGSPTFDAIATGTNTTAAMTVGSGGSLLTSGTGTIDATSGDSATAFFDAGTIEHEYGGLEASVAAYSGLLAVSGGATSEVDAKSELETQIADVADFAEADGDTWTGVHDAGGATSFEIPNGAANTVNADGEISHDTTADQIVYGADPTVLHPTQCETLIVENLAAADDNYPLGMKNFARTITAIGVHCAGTCTTGADISLEDRAGNAMTHTTPTHSTGTGNTTFQSVTAANALVSGEGLRFDVDNAVSPETDTYEITVCYTVDRQ